jgi:hypothetical protein
MKIIVHRAARGAFTRHILFLSTLLLTGRQAGLGQGVPAAQPSSSTELRALPGHVPAVVARLTPLGPCAPTNQIRLAIGVQLRDPAGLNDFLADLYAATSTNYQHYLAPAEFTARFGPTDQDYAAVKDFARANGFQVAGESGNRLVLDVLASVGDVERAFHVKLNRFQHPTEAREFFAPDIDPTVNAALRVADVGGLSDYGRPRPMLHRRLDYAPNLANGGSGPYTGGFFGNDFRNAYVPGTTLTGAGQTVGLVQFDGYYASDISSYAAAAGNGRSSITVQAVLLDGYDGTPTTTGNAEVSLDIEMAMSMAPGLSKIMVFEAGPDGEVLDVLNAMAASNTVRNLSSSWTWSGGPTNTQEALFQEMAAQGQCYFSASGDNDAFVSGSANDVDNADQDHTPTGSPNVAQVGGTALTMNGTGASYASETVWNERTANSNGGEWGSSGGYSTNYPIPSWQTNLSMSANGGSTVYRNIPDVAMNATNVEVYYEDGSHDDFGGTSCAAPLWAGFLALVNQQATAIGHAPAGLINAAVYAIGKGQNTNYSYAECFHDTTVGDNSWSASSGKYAAVTGYDLCTGWGSPAGTNLIDALSGGTLAGAVDHLTMSTIASTQILGRPFAITVTAQNASNATVTNFTGTVALSATGGDQQTNMLWSDGFENGSLSGWTLKVPDDYDTVEITTNAAAVGDASLFMLGGNDTPCDGLTHTLSNLTPSRINFYVASATTYLAAGYFLVGTNFYGTNSAAFFYMNNNGTMGLYDGTNWHSTSYAADQWYEISLHFNWTAKTIDFYVDDSLVQSGIPFRNPGISALTMLNLYNFNYAEAWYDEIEFLGAGPTAIALSPTNSGAFVRGAWTGNITVQQAATNVILTATDAAGQTVQSTSFSAIASVTPWFSAISKLTNGQTELTFSGAPSSNYTVSVSSNLSTWQTLATVTMATNGSASLTDATAGQARRFYRAALSK